MRNNFSDLINSGVASFNYQPLSQTTPTLDPMVKAYNNLWGALTDTHMSLTPAGEYIITGTFTQSRYWDGFKYASYYGSTNIKLGSGFYNLENMMNVYGYTMTNDLFNGDNVIKLVPRTSEDSTANCPCPCADTCCGTCCVGESQIPHPLYEFFSQDQIKDLNKAWRDAGNDAYKLVENINNSDSLKGIGFRITADNKYLIHEGTKRIKINL